MIRIEIKPLSVNEAWQGTRFKSTAYKHYENSLLYVLPKIKLPEPPYSVFIEYGFSSKGSDIDNPTKMILDIMQKKYLFNDSKIYRLILEKKIVPKGKEYFEFKIITYLQT